MRPVAVVSALLAAVVGAVGLAASAKEAASGTALFRETWSYHAATKAAIKLGTGETEGLWFECFRDNAAWVVARGETKESQGDGYSPLAAPPTWDVKAMQCLPGESSSRGSLWLPFGSHGLNRVQRTLARPRPSRGAVDCLVWAPSPDCLRERGVTVLLETPRGEASIAFGLWAGTPRYKVTGIRKGERGYDDLLYHRIPEIRIGKPLGAAKAPGTWYHFVVDIGKTVPGGAVFGLGALGSDIQYGRPIELVAGKDYTSVKAIVIGSLPYARYAGTDANGDNALFVGDVVFTMPPQK